MSSRAVRPALWHWMRLDKMGLPLPVHELHWVRAFQAGAREANVRRMIEGFDRAVDMAKRIAFKEVVEGKKDKEIAEDFNVKPSTIANFRRNRSEQMGRAYAWVEHLTIMEGARERAISRAHFLKRVEKANDRYDEVLYDDEASPGLKFRIAKDVLDRVVPPTKKVEHSGAVLKTLNIKTLNLIGKSVERGEMVPREVEGEVLEAEEVEEDDEEVAALMSGEWQQGDMEEFESISREEMRDG